MASNTNVDFYAAGFDSSGKRVCSLICDFNPDKNADKVAMLLAKVKAISDDVAVAEIITADEFNDYLAGKVRGSDGKPIDYIPPEPTEAEKKAATISSIKEKYNAQLDAMVTARVKATMLGADTSKIDANYKNTLAAMAAEIKTA
ncbi:hypothetical protein [Megasphaera sp.]|jgi:hypothetical protein|uniref:hypothetical protein n=1 Tax=Megasphaera sp. TaxID=2023260 RepID=UPI003FF15303